MLLFKPKLWPAYNLLLLPVAQWWLLYLPGPNHLKKTLFLIEIWGKELSGNRYLDALYYLVIIACSRKGLNGIGINMGLESWGNALTEVAYLFRIGLRQPCKSFSLCLGWPTGVMLWGPELLIELTWKQLWLSGFCLGSIPLSFPQQWGSTSRQRC